MSDDDFYHLALLPNDPTKITLISAVVDAKDPLLHQQLKSWREELDRHFAYAKLRDSPKDEGVFQKVVPPFLQPKPTGPSLADQREQQRLERRKNKQREAAEAPSPAPPSAREATVPARSKKRPREEEKGEPQLASVCLIAKEASAPRKTLSKFVKQTFRDPNQRGPQTPRIEHPGSEHDGKLLCFDFITVGVGCIHNPCRFFHADIDKQETKDVSPGYLRSLQKLLHHPQVSPHFKSTAKFVTHLAELGES